MRFLTALWEFVAGESRLAPIGLLVAVLTAAALVRAASPPGPVVGIVYVAIVVAALLAGVFERTG